jgi:hypothetical protein
MGKINGKQHKRTSRTILQDFRWAAYDGFDSLSSTDKAVDPYD